MSEVPAENSETYYQQLQSDFRNLVMENVRYENSVHMGSPATYGSVSNYGARTIESDLPGEPQTIIVFAEHVYDSLDKNHETEHAISITTPLLRWETDSEQDTIKRRTHISLSKGRFDISPDPLRDPLLTDEEYIEEVIETIRWIILEGS
jgi:hypothetical protein